MCVCVSCSSICRPKTGFQLWLEENRKSILADDPDMEETAVIKEAMGRFRTLSAEERLVRGCVCVCVYALILSCSLVKMVHYSFFLSFFLYLF